MRYIDDDEPPSGGGPATRFDRWGTRRGNPYAADPRYDDPDAVAGAAWDATHADGDDEPSQPRQQPWTTMDVTPPLWQAVDGAFLSLPVPLWTRMRMRPRLPVHLGRMVGRARRIGSLRSPRTGERYPVYRGSAGRRSWRIVARPNPRRRQQHEIVALLPELEAFPLNASPSAPERRRSSSGGGRGGYRLRLTHGGLHTILSRLTPERLGDLAGGALPADPAAAIARAVGRLARRARREGGFRPRAGGGQFDVFSAPGWRLLVRPLGEMEGEIVGLRGIEGEMEEEVSITGTMTWQGPFTFQDRGDPVTAPAALLKKSGIYLAEQNAGSGWGPIYVGKGDNFLNRLRERRDILRHLKVPLGQYRFYLGTYAGTDPTSPKLTALEHAVVRTIINRFHPPTGPLATVKSLKSAGGWQAIPPLTNLSPKEPFKVGAPGLSLTHAGGPAYLQAGTRKPGEWFEFE